MLCLWRRTFNHMRRSLDGFTSMTAPIRDSGRLIAPLSSAADHQKCCDTFAGYRVVYAVDA